jgi:bifunctional non-homologous end joining protein LigD
VKKIKRPFPSSVKPMLCTLVKEPFTKPGWIYEIKWDGYRMLAFKHKAKVILRSRSGLDYTDRYPTIVNSLKKIKSDFVIDGEVVAFDENGKISFDAVQNVHRQAPLTYYIFDLLWVNDYSVMQLTLIDRKRIVKSMVPPKSVIKFSDSFADGIALYEQAQKLDLEGIVAKKADSTYQPGKRGKDWLKIPTAKRQEFIIGGYAESEKARSFRSLLFGAYNKDGELEWIGRSGGGFKEKEMPGILKRLKELEIEKSPFVNKILDTKGAKIHYVKPELVANFKFATWTESGRIRKPATFLGFRYDKKAKDV